MHLRATAVLVVTKPAAAETYRVWLIQQLQFQSRITLRLQDLVSSTAADTLLHLPRPVARHLRHHLLCNRIGHGHAVV